MYMFCLRVVRGVVSSLPENLRAIIFATLQGFPPASSRGPCLFIHHLHHLVGLSAVLLATALGLFAATPAAAQSADVTVSLRVVPNSVVEGGTVRVIVELSAALERNIDVPIVLEAGTMDPAEEGDYGSLTPDNRPERVFITRGSTTGTGELTTTLDEDTDDETFTVSLGSPLPAGLVAGATVSETVTIRDVPRVTGIELSAGGSAVPLDRPFVSTMDDYTARVTEGTDRVSLVVRWVGDLGTVRAISYGPGGSSTDFYGSEVLVSGEAAMVRLSPRGGFTTILIQAGSRNYQLRVNLPMVSLSAMPNPVMEGEEVVVTAELSEAVRSELVIPVKLMAVTAEPEDYGLLSSITIEGGETSGTGRIRTVQDADEDDESFTVALGDGLPTAVVAGTPTSVTVVITEDDDVVAERSVVELSVVPNPVEEGEEVVVAATVSAALSGDVEVPIVLRAVTAEAGDYGVLTGITITGGATRGVGRITTAKDEDTDDESFMVSLGSPLPAELVAGREDSVLVVVEDEDRMVETVARLNRSVLPELARASSGRTMRVIGERVEGVLDGGGAVREVRLAGQPTLLGAVAARVPGFLEGTASVTELLDGSGFALPLSATGSGGGVWSSAVLWGSGDWRRLSGVSDDLDWDGSLYGAEVGMDVRWHEGVLSGVALSWSSGDFTYSGGDSGEYRLDILSIHPYLGGRYGGMDFWVTGGYGTGEVEVVSAEVLSGDVDLWTVGAGGSGELWSDGDMALRLKGEFLRTEMEVEEGLEVSSLSVVTTLARVGLEGSRTVLLSGGGEFRPSLSLGARYDGGDGDTGTGAELRGGLGYVSAGGRMSAKLSVQGLLGRGDYEEWGVSAQVALLSGLGGRGWSFALRPGYGSGIAEGGSTGRIWGQGVRKDAVDAVVSSAGLRMESRLGYGFAAGEGRLVTPWGGMTLDDIGRRYRLGLDWGLGSLLRLNLSAERREAAGVNTDHAVLMEGEVRF